MFFKTMRAGNTPMAPLMLLARATPGIFAGTKIATRNDWTPIEQLDVGDFVLTAEHGEQVITSISVSELDPSSNIAVAKKWPIHVPEDVLGNSNPMTLSPGMHLVLEDEAATELFGQPCVSIKAEDLIGYRGIARARMARPMIHFSLEFTHGVSLVVEGGVLFDMPSPRGARRFTPLNAKQARLLMRNIGPKDHSHRQPKLASGWI